MDLIKPKYLQSLYELKTILMKVFLTFAVLVIVGIWWTEVLESHVNPIDRIAYPSMIAVFGISAFWLHFKPKSLRRVEYITFTTFAAYCFVNFQAMLFGLSLFIADLYSVATFLQWLPMVYISAFIMLEIRNAIIASSLFYASLVASIISYRFIQYVPDLTLNKIYLTAMVVCFAHPVYILMLLGIALLKEQLVQTKTQAENMSVAATTDYLTGITNRRFATQSLFHLLELAKIENFPLTVFVLDIDHFKQVNDSFGHDVGDRVLICLASFLRQNLRDSDVLGRWGGEEFIVILQKTDLQTACHLAERLYERNSEWVYEKVGHVTFSIGIATSRPDDTTDSLFKRADASLYQAKQNGRDRFEIAV